jgi:transposase
MKNMRQSILGIDIAKSKFDVFLLHQGKQRHRIFSNCSEGFEQLSAWLVKQELDKVHACLEVTGTYGEALGTYLYQTGHQVSMVNPLCIQAFGQSQLTRNKTDKSEGVSRSRRRSEPLACVKKENIQWLF